MRMRAPSPVDAAYEAGYKAAFSVAGLALPGEAEADDDHTARNVAMAAAAASPFLGLVGQQPVIHDPVMNRGVRRTQTLTELSRLAQPGDILLTGKPSGSMWKAVISPTSGSEFYHAQPVLGRSDARRAHGLTASAGEYSDPSFKSMSQKDLLRELNTVEQLGKEYPNITLLRPKKPMTAAETKTFVNNALQRSTANYDTKKALGTWLKEIFLPKVELLGDGKSPVMCKGNVCSTLPAMAYERTGRRVIPGKAAKDIFPPDFLRSTEFEPVAAHIGGGFNKPRINPKLMPYLFRGALGLGLGGATYALSEDPALASLPLGALAGSIAAEKLNKSITGKKEPIPNLFKFLDELPTARGADRTKLLKGYLGKRLPATLAGGALSYLAASKLKDALVGD